MFPKKQTVTIEIYNLKDMADLFVLILYVPVNNFFRHVGKDLPGLNQY